MIAPFNCFRYILFSAELPRYAFTFVTGRTHQSLSADLAVAILTIRSVIKKKSGKKQDPPGSK